MKDRIWEDMSYVFEKLETMCKYYPSPVFNPKLVDITTDIGRKCAVKYDVFAKLEKLHAEYLSKMNGYNDDEIKLRLGYISRRCYEVNEELKELLNCVEVEE